MSLRAQLLGQLRASGFVRAKGGGDIRDLNSNAENWAVVKAALTAGFYPNIARVDREAMQLRTMQVLAYSLLLILCYFLFFFAFLLFYLKTWVFNFRKESMVVVHPSSTLRDADIRDGKIPERLPTDWVVFEEMSRAGKLCQIRMCTVISPITVALFAGPMRLSSDALSPTESKRYAHT